MSRALASLLDRLYGRTGDVIVSHYRDGTWACAVHFAYLHGVRGTGIDLDEALEDAAGQLGGGGDG